MTERERLTVDIGRTKETTDKAPIKAPSLSDQLQAAALKAAGFFLARHGSGT